MLQTVRRLVQVGLMRGLPLSIPFLSQSHVWQASEFMWSIRDANPLATVQRTKLVQALRDLVGVVFPIYALTGAALQENQRTMDQWSFSY